MSSPVEFYFEFSSPYAYFAAQKIDQIAEDNGSKCIWKPFLLGAAFHKTGMVPLTEQIRPLKRAFLAPPILSSMGKDFGDRTECGW